MGDTERNRILARAAAIDLYVTDRQTSDSKVVELPGDLSPELEAAAASEALEMLTKDEEMAALYERARDYGTEPIDDQRQHR